MRFLVQRVARAAVTVEGKKVGEIGRGFLVFVGISKSDIMEGLTTEKDISVEKDTSVEKELANHSLEIAGKMTKKLLGLRIFEDKNGKTNLDLKSVGGSLLMISQFTLYADCRKGNRPSFTNAGEPEKANLLYRYIVDLCRREIEAYRSMEDGHSLKAGRYTEKESSTEGGGSVEEQHFSPKVEEGIFGADMKVELINDGPFTVLLDSDEIIH